MENNKECSAKCEKLGPGGGGAVFIPTFSYKSADNFLLHCDMTGTYLTHDGGSSSQQINLAGGASSYAWDPSDSNIVSIGSDLFITGAPDERWDNDDPNQLKSVKTTDFEVVQIGEITDK